MNLHVRKPYGRHSAGTSMGWLDGHASWMQAEAFPDKWAEEEKERNGTYALGLWSWGPMSWRGVEADVPTLR